MGGHLWEPGDTYQILPNMALGAVQYETHATTGGSATTLENSSTDFQAVGVQACMCSISRPAVGAE